jgi:hypothetical protein
MTEIADDVLLAAYAELGSVWKVGERVGMSGQTVHYRLKRLGANKPTNVLSVTDAEKIRRYYEDTPSSEFHLDTIATMVGRPRTSVSAYARKMGLSNLRRPASTAGRERMRAAHSGQWSRKPHPRGMAGKKHSDETLALVSEASLRAWQTAKETRTGLMSPEQCLRRTVAMSERAQRRSPHESYSRARRGVRSDIGPWCFRSSWEANYARLLQHWLLSGVIERWEYEPERFHFPLNDAGLPLSYLPDFRVWEEDGAAYYIEIKGWFDAKSKARLSLMAELYPDVPLLLVDARRYYEIEASAAPHIPGWEKDQRNPFRGSVP